MIDDIRELYLYLVKKKCKLEFDCGLYYYFMYGNDDKRYLSFGVANTNNLIKNMMLN